MARRSTKICPKCGSCATDGDASVRHCTNCEYVGSAKKFTGGGPESSYHYPTRGTFDIIDGGVMKRAQFHDEDH